MILMISIETLKDEYLLDENIEDKFILSNVKKCQDFVIREILGEDKYNQLIADIDASTVSLSDDELIKDYIQPVIAYYVMSEVVYTTAFKFKNEPNSVNFDELVKISNKYRHDSERYQVILKEYMCDNSIPVDSNNTYRTGIYLGSSKGINYDERP